jgi:hypothetical protein
MNGFPFLDNVRPHSTSIACGDCAKPYSTSSPSFVVGNFEHELLFLSIDQNFTTVYPNESMEEQKGKRIWYIKDFNLEL